MPPFPWPSLDVRGQARASVGHLFLSPDGGWEKRGVEDYEYKCYNCILSACSAIQTCVQSFFCASSEDVRNNAWVRPIGGWPANPSRHGREPFLSLPSVRNPPWQICPFARFIPPIKSAVLCRLEYLHDINGMIQDSKIEDSYQEFSKTYSFRLQASGLINVLFLRKCGEGMVKYRRRTHQIVQGGGAR